MTVVLDEEEGVGGIAQEDIRVWQQPGGQTREGGLMPGRATRSGDKGRGHAEKGVSQGIHDKKGAFGALPPVYGYAATWARDEDFERGPTGSNAGREPMENTLLMSLSLSQQGLDSVRGLSTLTRLVWPIPRPCMNPPLPRSGIHGKLSCCVMLRHVAAVCLLAAGSLVAETAMLPALTLHPAGGNTSPVAPAAAALVREASPQAGASDLSAGGGKTAFERNVERVFADDQVADVRIIFGYDNSADVRHVNDPFRAEYLLEYLKKSGYLPVAPDDTMRKKLGVTGEAKNLRVFEGAGLHGRRLQVSLIWSARTTSFARNIGSEYVEQIKCSEEALSFMQKAAEDAEVMMYVGHSREGGGPDTFPPEIKRGGGESLHRVDFAPYRANRPGLAALAGHFGKNKHKPCIVSWASCKSDNHFAGWMKRVMAGKEHDTSLLLSTRFTTYHAWIAEIADNDEGLMATVCLLEALQYAPSEKAFVKRLDRCEIESERLPGKPAWRLSFVPGSGGASGGQGVAATP